MISRSLLLVLLAPSLAAAAPRNESLVFANCPRESGEYVGSFRARIRLHKEFLGDGKIEDSIEQP